MMARHGGLLPQAKHLRPVLAKRPLERGHPDSDNGFMSYQIPPDLEARVQAQVDTGRFVCIDDVVREALDTLEKRQRGLVELQEMVREAEADVAAGRLAEFDIDRTIKAIDARLSQ